jgi:hypothetical protein
MKRKPTTTTLFTNTFYLIHIVNNHIEGYKKDYKELVREIITTCKQMLMANMAPSYSKYTSIGEMCWVQQLHRCNGNPAILLQCPPRALWEQGTYLALKLLAVLANPDSQTYSMSVRSLTITLPRYLLNKTL